MLKDPLYQTEVVAPVAVIAEVAAVVETAANKNVAVDSCPICDKPMRRLLAAGLPTYTCFDHRVTLPAMDSQG